MRSSILSRDAKRQNRHAHDGRNVRWHLVEWYEFFLYGSSPAMDTAATRLKCFCACSVRLTNPLSLTRHLQTCVTVAAWMSAALGH